MANVSIDHVTKSYGALHVMHGVSLDIEDGEFIILVGPSGCGKSTLLRMIAGLEEITTGTVSIGNKVVNDARPKDRNIAMVFQSYALYPHKTVAQNMGFALMLAGRSQKEIDDRVRAAAEILDLVPLLKRLPKQLSGGQRQRVAMGRAIVRNPEVFLFDEPLSNLDAKLRVQMRTEIKALHQRLKTTTIYVTHDQVEAMTMADRIVIMNGGKIEQVGPPLVLYDNPNSLFVAGFLGSPSMNFLDGRVEGGEFRTERGLTFALPAGLARTADGRSLVAGIRPEHIELARDGKALIDTTVIVDEPTGAETQIALRSQGEEILATFRDRLAVNPGDRLPVHFPLDKLYLFDKASGLRISSGNSL
ncbi:ABC transporter ATP-binding protein [Rhizobium leguminosarum]|uniref:ABC transporter ATP-binding protein n=1 Tax=Rhizobium leguminosarum TaxID=384 RepID=UPI001C954685|nr:sn-glycerol-3-phosphate ABC transporter ATP-binding protein UgpC [Rhizobium leguminosarum]MBY5349351.1 sn-glycerol-3-phosphate ABC transporter ATP-binding protein UgpC [Rhizobium leguminosarum]